MKTFRFTTASEYITAIANETKSAERAALLTEYKEFRTASNKEQADIANTRAKLELQEQVSASVQRSTANFKMSLQEILTALNGADITISEFIEQLNDSTSVTSKALETHLTEQASQFSIREQWVQGRRRLSL